MTTDTGILDEELQLVTQSVNRGRLPMSAIQTQAGVSPMQDTDGPRKRRKRAPAAGAADDCFTCASRNVKCDRRRPYCSQCLNNGQDCKGYKTQLTWGVGVASRGKLRGLSLPVAGTKRAAEPISTPKKKSKANEPMPIQFAEPNGLTSTQIDPTTSNISSSESTSHTRQSSSQGISTKDVNVTAYPQLSSGVSLPPQSPSEFYPSPAGSYILQSPSHTGWPQHSSLPLELPYEQHQFPHHRHQNEYWAPSFAHSAPSHNTLYAETGLQHASSGSLQTTSVPAEYHTSTNSLGITTHGFSTSEPINVYTQQSDMYGQNEAYATPSSAYPEPLSTTSVMNFAHSHLEEDVEEITRDENSISDNLSVTSQPLIFDINLNYSPFSGINAVGKTPRMQYLIQYYAEVIAPVIVAFDSPTNPFRNQLLSLAMKSDCLQHALSALASSNLRQRRESGSISTGKTLPARRSSAAHVNLSSIADDAYIVLSPQEQRREESYHKQVAVRSLNQALASQDQRKDDAILATLLILCLFHICDSGVARFQTQFAGVKKLLNLRQQTLGSADHSTRWITRLFAWFDAMAATTNDRTGQFDSNMPDTSMAADGEWSYETLCGVDSRLFKMVSKLGRLNLLSQGKNVEGDHETGLHSLPTQMTAPMSSSRTFDGNGWRHTTGQDDFFVTSSNPQDASVQEQFWREWHEVGQELKSWNPDTLIYESSHTGPSQLTDEQKVDIGNISNAFRFAALLYLERLGNPKVPSVDEKIQFWVRRALLHIKQVRSDVYLLWPLFITGSECVHEDGRAIIRERCLDIQKDSGFENNASCLGLLEKVWRIVPVVDGNEHLQDERSSQQQQPDGALRPSGEAHLHGFRFRDIMKAAGTEGEWIVV